MNINNTTPFILPNELLGIYHTRDLYRFQQIFIDEKRDIPEWLPSTIQKARIYVRLIECMKDGNIEQAWYQAANMIWDKLDEAGFAISLVNEKPAKDVIFPTTLTVTDGEGRTLTMHYSTFVPNITYRMDGDVIIEMLLDYLARPNRMEGMGYLHFFIWACNFTILPDSERLTSGVVVSFTGQKKEIDVLDEGLPV
jgi:hypothetical protein